MKSWTENRVVLLGNVPPRDVLAQGTPDQIRDYTQQMLGSVTDHSRIIVSCAGGMPPGAPTQNIQALIDAARSFSS